MRKLPAGPGCVFCTHVGKTKSASQGLGFLSAKSLNSMEYCINPSVQSVEECDLNHACLLILKNKKIRAAVQISALLCKWAHGTLSAVMSRFITWPLSLKFCCHCSLKS